MLVFSFQKLVGFSKFSRYDTRSVLIIHGPSMIQTSILWTTAVCSNDHNFHTWSAMKIDRYDTFHKISCMINDHEATNTGLRLWSPTALPLWHPGNQETRNKLLAPLYERCFSGKWSPSQSIQSKIYLWLSVVSLKSLVSLFSLVSLVSPDILYHITGRTPHLQYIFGNHLKLGLS